MNGVKAGHGPAGGIRRHPLIRHAVSEDLSSYPLASFKQRWYALALDLSFLAPLDMLINVPFERLLERYQVLGDVRYHVLSIVLSALPVVLYFVAPTLVSGQTLGKRIVGIQVVRSSFDADLSLGLVLRREVLGKVFSIATLLLGYLLALVDSRRRALHDHVAGTLVISHRE